MKIFVGGEWPSRTYTYYYLAIDFSKDSFVLPNPVKDEKGNPVAPVASENYSYNAAANELIIPTTSIEYGELKGAVEYEFTMTAQTGDVLEVEHALDANVMGIKTQPQSMEILSGESGTLSVGWVGWGNTCQWYKDGVEIPGATDYQLKLNNVTKADEGSYTVVTSTDFGGKVATPLSVTSNPAVVTVKVPINITSQPEDLTLVEGQSGTLSVSASGEGNLSYQWYKGNSVITGANTAVLALNNVTMNDAGEYKVAISNAEGEVTSDVATVEVEEALEIVTQPADTSIIEGESGSLSVEAVGAGTLTYQWYKGSEAINGATAATLGLNNVTKETAGSYQVKVTDKNGNVTSSAANVTIEEKLEITGQPENITVIEGKNGVLTVTAIGEGTLSYQWYKGDTAISGATTASLALNDISLADAGEYTVKVTDKNGTVTSNAAMVTVEKKLVITEAPKGITVLEGKDGSLSVTAVGEGTLSYQWYKGDVKLNGANAATLELQKVDLSDAGEYKVVVTDKNGSITSRVAVVTVEKALKITNQPTGISLLEGEKGSLSVTAVGEGTLSYQWYKDDILLDGETDETLNLNNVALSDAGAYKVVVSDKNGSLTSDTAIVVVDKMLKITNQPQGIALVEGKNGTLSVSAIGEGTVSYQWYKGDEAITGATQETLNLTNVSMEDAGQYKVVVTDANKSITSNVVAVVVEKELTITKQPTGITLIEGENGSLLAEAIGADAISYQWYKDDVVVEGATNATYVFANVELADAGLYKVVVSDKNGNITSDVVEVVVEKALKIVKQPEGLSLEEDEAGSITVIASGEGTLSYQWYKDGVAIQGETAATLHFKALGLADEGQYMVEIHDKNSVLTSAVAEVEIEEEDDEEDEEEEVVGVIVSPKTGETGNLVWLLAAVLMALAGVTTFKKKEQ